MRRKTFRQRMIRTGFLASNIVVVVAVAFFILQNPRSTSAAALVGIPSDQSSQAVINPLDQLSSATIAETVSRMASLPETTAITNQADSQTAELTMASTDDSVVSKPQVVATALKSRANIEHYITKAGDTISAIATTYGVTSDSIRWSNNVTGDAVAAGTNLVIPPVNGIVYTVQTGDTVASLASTYSANTAKIIAFNDAEITGIKIGEQIVIPDGTKAAPVTAAAIVADGDDSDNSTAYPWGGNSAVYGSNGYDFGYCTWYVATRISVPSNWGNADTWDNLAPLSGWTVSTVPKVGAIAQTDRGAEGHVAYVEAVSADGSQIKFSDMNGLAGWGRVGYSGWVSASTFEHYIYR
jgi:surface antigen